MTDNVAMSTLQSHRLKDRNFLPFSLYRIISSWLGINMQFLFLLNSWFVHFRKITLLTLSPSFFSLFLFPSIYLVVSSGLRVGSWHGVYTIFCLEASKAGFWFLSYLLTGDLSRYLLPWTSCDIVNLPRLAILSSCNLVVKL